MKKKMLAGIIMIGVIIVFVLGGWYIAFTRFGVGPAFPFLAYTTIEAKEMDMDMIAENQLTALAETEEMAQTIADQYGIELKSFEHGVAVYHTGEDPFAVIARGQEEGYTQLSINFVRNLNEGEGTQLKRKVYSEEGEGE